MKKSWNFRLSFWLRIIIILCGFLVNAIIINNYLDVGSDFVQDYIAANSLRKGGSVYGEDIKNLGKELVGSSGVQNFHPPFNAMLFLPLSFLNYQEAFIVLNIFSLMLLFLINRLVVRGLELSGEWLLNITCFTLFWYPVIYCLGLGQSSMIIAACLISGWFYLRSKKEYAASFLFAIATLMKLFPGLVLLYLLMSKNWRAFSAMILFIILGLSVTGFIVGFDNIQTYATVMISRDVDEYGGLMLNHSVSGIITRSFGERTGWTEPLIHLPHISSLLIFLLNLLLFIFIILKMNKMERNQEVADYAFGLTIVGMLLLSPITWGHIFPVLILPISLLLKEYIRDPSPRNLRILLLIILLLSLPDVLIARGLMALHHPFRMPWYSMLLTLGPSAGLLLMYFKLIRNVSTTTC
jgi:hypothetical protein